MVAGVSVGDEAVTVHLVIDRLPVADGVADARHRRACARETLRAAAPRPGGRRRPPPPPARRRRTDAVTAVNRALSALLGLGLLAGGLLVTAEVASALLGKAS